jgi:hypothetical protein
VAAENLVDDGQHGVPVGDVHRVLLDAVDTGEFCRRRDVQDDAGAAGTGVSTGEGGAPMPWAPPVTTSTSPEASKRAFTIPAPGFVRDVVDVELMGGRVSGGAGAAWPG